MSGPEPEGSQIRIRTGFYGACATDLNMIASWERTGFHASSGHEWPGTVDAVKKNVPTNILGHKCVEHSLLASDVGMGSERPSDYADYHW